jgi:hypothetical protein
LDLEVLNDAIEVGHLDVHDLRQHRLSDVSHPLRHETAVAEEETTFEVEGGGVVERGGELENAEEEFDGEAVEHGGREVERVD